MNRFSGQCNQGCTKFAKPNHFGSGLKNICKFVLKSALKTLFLKYSNKEGAGAMGQKVGSGFGTLYTKYLIIYTLLYKISQDETSLQYTNTS